MRNLVCILIGVAVGVCPARAARFYDKAVENAIQRGAAFLLKSQQPNGSWGTYGRNRGDRNYHHTGPTALVVYALLESGLDPQDPRIKKSLDWVGRYDERGTYSLGLRCCMWEAANRKAKGKFRKVLYHDASRLWKSTAATGNYDYRATGRARAGRWDNSNSQYGLLGVWAASLANIEVPLAYWRVVARHWEKTQNPDGGWGYARGNGSTAGMVTAGVASLFVAYDETLRARFANCGVADYYLRVKKGIDWIDRNFANTLKGENLGHADIYYYLYGIERVGLASGQKYFGKIDWYKQGAAYLVGQQQGDGSWQGKWMDRTVATAYALLFLVRGRNSVIINKLEFDGDWNNRPRDLANFTRWMSYMFERTLNWQTVNLSLPVSEWDDAPILYISGSRLPKFTDDHVRKLRTFCLQGGAIVSATECGGVAGFKKGIRDLYQRMFPNYKLTQCPPGHDIYSRRVHFDLAAGRVKVRVLPSGVRLPSKATKGPARPRPTFHILSNGVRPLAVHTDEDMPLSWQLRKTVTQRWAFEAGVNVVRYITDSVSEVRPRGTGHWPGPFRGGCTRTAKLVRLKHPGNFDPEPLAYQRFVRLMGRRAKTDVKVAGPIDIGDLPDREEKLAVLTGTDKLVLSEAEQAVLKKFVEGGGLLLIDAAGGSKSFADSAERILRKMFGALKVRRLASTAGLFSLPGMRIEKVKYRRRTRSRLMNPKLPNFKAVLVGKRVGVLLSREDLTAGLAGYPAFTIDGYDPESAFLLMRNIVLSAN